MKPNKVHQFAAGELKRLFNGRNDSPIRLSSGEDAENGFLQRLRGMFIQLRAQEAIQRKDIKTARRLLEKVLAMKGGVLKPEREICKRLLLRFTVQRFNG